MIATTHPDATAFAARFLAHPDDRHGRMVFADWLDEQGGESNAAWARYLRYMAHAEEDFDDVFADRADSLGRVVRARLTLPKPPGNALLPWLSAFLLAHRIWVRVGGRRIPQAVCELCPESVARRYQTMPVAVVNRRVYFVTGVPSDVLDDSRDLLCSILNQRVVLLRSEPDDVVCAVNNHYGWVGVESVGGIVRSPEPR